MNQPVIIKGNKYGITLVLDNELAFPKLCDKIRMKFKESSKFFNTDDELAICFEGRKLDSDEIDKVLEIINGEVSKV